jgi:hypothetical protein
MTSDSERLAKIAELLPNPCHEPGIANGMDLCRCGSGEVFPCSITQAAWLAAGLDVAEENRKALAPVKQQMAAEHAAWEALNEVDPAAARRAAQRALGW